MQRHFSTTDDATPLSIKSPSSKILLEQTRRASVIAGP
jgi:hypothetical protein